MGSELSFRGSQPMQLSSAHPRPERQRRSRYGSAKERSRIRSNEPSREEAEECSPRRKPWSQSPSARPAPKGRKKSTVFARVRGSTSPHQISKPPRSPNFLL